MPSWSSQRAYTVDAGCGMCKRATRICVNDISSAVGTPTWSSLTACPRSEGVSSVATAKAGISRRAAKKFHICNREMAAREQGDRWQPASSVGASCFLLYRYDTTVGFWRFAPPLNLNYFPKQRSRFGVCRRRKVLKDVIYRNTLHPGNCIHPLVSSLVITGATLLLG